MKKYTLALAVLICLGAGILYWLWPKAHVNQPIIMSAQLNEGTKTIEVSYIVEKNNATYLDVVARDENKFYTPKAGGNWNDKTYTTNVLVTQDGFELREDIVQLTDEQFAYFLSLEDHASIAEFTFAGYQPITKTLAILLEEEAVEVTKEEDALRYTYTATSDETIEDIGHYDSVAGISFEQNNREVTFPLTLKKGESVAILFSETYKFSSNDKLLLEIVLADGERITKNIAMTQSIRKGYLKEIVERENNSKLIETWHE